MRHNAPHDAGARREVYRPPHLRRGNPTAPLEQQRSRTRSRPAPGERWADGRGWHVVSPRPAEAAQWPDLPVDVEGSDNPPGPSHAETWAECDELHGLVRTNLVAAGYQRPTLLQRHAVTVVAAMHDLLVTASMHSPESLVAFLAPLISDLHISAAAASAQKQPHQWREDLPMLPQAVVVAPHAELATQILDEVRRLAQGSSLRSALLDEDGERLPHEQAHVLVSVPGRLADAIDRGQVSLHLTRFVVIYEVDRQLDAGLDSCIHRIAASAAVAESDAGRCVWLFSATLPQGIRRLASQLLRENRRLNVIVGRWRPSGESIRQTLVCVDDELDKPRVVGEILREGDRLQQLTAVFVQTKRGVDGLAEILERERDAPVVAIHGDTPRLERESRLASFLSGVTPVLVATEVTVRGSLHQQRNDGDGGARPLHVINYDMPSDIDEYVHHIGHARLGGRSTVLVSPARDAAVLPELAKLLRESDLEVPEWLERVAPSASAAKTPAW